MIAADEGPPSPQDLREQLYELVCDGKLALARDRAEQLKTWWMAGDWHDGNIDERVREISWLRGFWMALHGVDHRARTRGGRK